MGELLNKFISENQERTLAYLRKRFTALDEEDLKDVYQESSMALFLNLLDGSYKQGGAGLYTYFLRICINQALKAVHKGSSTLPLDVDVKVGDGDEYMDEKLDELLNFIYEVEDYDPHEQARMENLVRAIMKELSERCQDLLWGHYGDGLSWEVLADMYELANANSARTTANRCRNQFRDLFNEKNARING